MYGEEYVRNEYGAARHAWFRKRHPTLCGMLPEWRLHKLYEATQFNVLTSRNTMEGIGTDEPEPQIEVIQ